MRHAVVTGAAGGIGSAIVRALLAQGAEVHGLDRDAAAQAALQKSLAAADRGTPVGTPVGPPVGPPVGSPAGERYHAHLIDLADRAACDRALLRLRQALGGRCDILVNNAGLSILRPFEASDDALLDATFALNFDAAFRITRALLPELRASGRAAVVNIASELALIGQPGFSVYCATKGALIAWTRALAVELAPERIRVNAVCPGPIDTPLLQREFDTYSDPGAARAAEVAAIPLGRLGQAAEIGAVVAFLAGEGAAFTTGTAWTVDGGKTAR
jgi:NAD(P)-dependent dehydrogenase (short-subunit alcohol dehydrogenase family)